MQARQCVGVSLWREPLLMTTGIQGFWAQHPGREVGGRLSTLQSGTDVRPTDGPGLFHSPEASAEASWFTHECENGGPLAPARLTDDLLLCLHTLDRSSCAGKELRPGTQAASFVQASVERRQTPASLRPVRNSYTQQASVACAFCSYERRGEPNRSPSSPAARQVLFSSTHVLLWLIVQVLKQVPASPNAESRPVQATWVAVH